MNYYHVSILGSPLEPFSYHSSNKLKTGVKVLISFSNKIKEGVVLNSTLKPDFTTNEILETFNYIYSAKQVELARFISTYYYCSLGDALGIMVPYK